MPEFMDVHTNMPGVTSEALMEAHQADLDIQDDEGVVFKHAWADPTSGHVFCLSEGPSADAVRRIHERTGHPADEIHQITVTAEACRPRRPTQPFLLNRLYQQPLRRTLVRRGRR